MSCFCPAGATRTGKTPIGADPLTRSRSFTRFQRWTAKLRRRHLRASLPEQREGELLLLEPAASLRSQGWTRDLSLDLDELHDSRL